MLIFSLEIPDTTHTVNKGNTIVTYKTNNPDAFWQLPGADDKSPAMVTD